ncbi:hypothetical protein FRB99_007376 [Tulasnella sp. 403]|nr:hypothetical protein FRB99_007376 [Tulasnella sp. 403]
MIPFTSTHLIDFNQVESRIIDDYFIIDGKSLEPLVNFGLSSWLSSTIIDARVLILRRTATPHIHLFTSNVAYIVDKSNDPDVLHAHPGLQVATRNPRYLHPQIHGCRPPLNLSEKLVWGFPMHYENHWLFGAIDFHKRELLFMDPFGGSSLADWGFTLLRDLVNHLRFAIDLPEIPFGEWTTRILCPIAPQNDQTSCGLFILEALSLLCADEDPSAILCFDPKEKREEILYLILSEPLHDTRAVGWRKAPWKVREPLGPPTLEVALRHGYDPTKPSEPADQQAEAQISMEVDDPDTTMREPSSPISRDASPMDLDTSTEPAAAMAMAQETEVEDAVMQEPTEIPPLPPLLGKIRRDELNKRVQKPESNLLPAGKTSPQEKAKGKRRQGNSNEPDAVPKRRRMDSRRKNQSRDARVALLQGDPHIIGYTPRSVTCRCRPTRPFALSQDFNLQNWESHVKVCTLHKPATKASQAFVHYFHLKPKPEMPLTSEKRPFGDATNTADSAPSSNPPPTVSQQPLRRKAALANLNTRLDCPRCKGLDDEPFVSLAKSCDDGRRGGVSPTQYPQIYRQLFPYKPWDGAPLVVPTPENGNMNTERNGFTDHEEDQFQNELSSLCIWVVDRETIRSVKCDGRTENLDFVCDACHTLWFDEGLKKLARKREEEALLPEDERLKAMGRRAKYTPLAYSKAQKIRLLHQLSDLQVGALLDSIASDSTPGGVYVKLAYLTRSGQFTLPQQVTDMVRVLIDKWERSNDPADRKKHGVRYPSSIINLALLLRTGSTVENYNIFKEICGFPDLRHIGKIKAARGEPLYLPHLCRENFARARHIIVEKYNWTGPVILQSDCTKLLPKLSFVTDFVHEAGIAGHVVGATLPLDQLAVATIDDLPLIIKAIQAKGDRNPAVGGYMRVTILKAPYPHIPPVVVAAYPTSNNENTNTMYKHIACAHELCEAEGFKLLSTGADGHKVERGAQRKTRQTPTGHRLQYSNPFFGINIFAPIFATGPLVDVQDVGHARKTARNNELSGTHLITLGSSTISFSTVARLYALSVSYASQSAEERKTPIRLLKSRDVFNVDKQDDGAARRLFHASTLCLMTEAKSPEQPDDLSVREGMEVIADSAGSNPVLLVPSFFGAGELFDSWLNRDLPHIDRLIIAFRARFFLHIILHDLKAKCDEHHDLFNSRQSFLSRDSQHILLRLSDSLILLILAHAETYPDTPLCPWEHGTESLEHLFGVSRQVLGNFKYAEFVKHLKAVTLRQQLVSSGKYNARKEKTSASGYLFDHFAHSDMSPKRTNVLTTFPTRQDIDKACQVGWDEASVICAEVLKITIPTLPLQPLDLDELLPLNDSEEDDLDGLQVVSGEDLQTISECTMPESMEPTEPLHDGLHGLQHSVLDSTRSTAALHALEQDLESARGDFDDSDQGPETQDLDAGLGCDAAPMQLAQAEGVDHISTVPRLANPPTILSRIIPSDTSVLSIFKIAQSRCHTQASSAVRSELILSISPQLRRRLQELEDSAFKLPPQDGLEDEADSAKSGIPPTASHLASHASDSTTLQRYNTYNTNEYSSLLRQLMDGCAELLPQTQKPRETFWMSRSMTLHCSTPEAAGVADSDEFSTARDEIASVKKAKGRLDPMSPGEAWNLGSKVQELVTTAAGSRKHKTSINGK